MKLRHILFAFLLSLAAFQFCYSQEKPKAILIDDFGISTCEEMSARIDAFFVELTNSPNARGYIVINGDRNRPREKYTHEKIFEDLIKLRNFDKSRIEFLHAKDKESIRTQFWKVPADGDKPTFDAEDWDFVLPKDMNPVMVHADSWISEVCPEVFGLQLYSKFISANPDLRGHLVIYDKSVEQFRKTEKDLLNQLVKKYKVSRSQLKFFFVKRKKSDVEFWLVPKKKK